MLFNSLRAPDSGVETIQTVVDLEHELDRARFERACGRLAEAHAVLRGSFRWRDGRAPEMVLHPSVALPVAWLDWSAVPAEERESRWQALLDEDRRRGFDLARAPLSRFAVVRLGPGRERLLWTAHHAQLDLPALTRLVSDLFRLYDAGDAGGEPPALDPGPPFTDYVAWEDALPVAASRGFWRERLAGAVLPTPLGIDRARRRDTDGTPPVPVRRLRRRLSAELGARLETWARAHRLPAQVVLEGAWALLLSRHGGERRVVFGSPRACRFSSVPGAHRVVGMLVSTVPVAVDVDPDARVVDWLRRLREEWLALDPHEHTPLEAIREACGAATAGALYENIFCYDLMEFDAAVRSTGVAWEGRRAESASQASCPLVLNVYGGAEPLLQLTHAPERIDGALAEHLLDHVETLVEALVSDRHERLRDLPLASSSELRELEEWGRAPRPAVAAEPEPEGGHVPVHVGFLEQARLRPDAPALIFEGAQLTYGELASRAHRLAHLLRARGVGPEVLVGLATARGPDLVTGVLGILEAGGAYVPLDLANPAERLAFVLADSGAQLVVTDRASRGRLPDGPHEVLCLEDLESELARLPDDAPPGGGAGPANAAYVIYTSGSTGRPKGVVVEHRNLSRLFTATESGFDFGPEDVWTLFHSSAFDFSVWELWGALLHGGRLVIVPRDVSRSPADFQRLLAREGVTVLSQTPSAFRQLDAVDAATLEPLALRWIVFGGEQLEVESLRPWLERHGDRHPRLVNMYGITETTVHVTWRPLSRADLDGGVGSPIGRGLPDLDVRVLDERGELAPVGVPGELCVGGAGVARGYLGRPALTAERFVPDPFADGRRPGARLYRSGDLARVLPGGELEFLGRADDQVKLRGFRVELGEIAAVLGGAPGVRAAAVDLCGEGDGKRLVGYVVPDRAGAGAIDGEHLQDFLAGRLPEYMVPVHYVALDALPLTPNGKLDRRALPEPCTPARGAATVAPRDAVEAALATVWCELLELEDAGVHDDFFRSGGHSLLAVRLVPRIRAELGVELPIGTVFERPTIAGLAAAVTEARDAGGATDGAGATALTPVARDGDLELSLAQQRLWFLQRLVGGVGYHVPGAVRLVGALDVDALRTALEGVAARHEILRTVFPERDGRGVQRVLDPRPVALPVRDLEGIAADRREEAAQAAAAEWIAEPFDVEREPPWRSGLLRLGARDHVLVLALHHLVFDGWSFAVLWRELAALYAAAVDGADGADVAAALPPLPIQVADYAAWQRRAAEGPAMERHLAHARTVLADPPVLDLATDRVRPPVQTFRGAAVPVALPASLTAALEALAHDAGATLFMALLAGWQALLARQTGQDDLIVGSPVSSRGRGETESLIGCFLDTLAFRTDLSGDPGFDELLARVRAVVLDAFEHRDLPFDRLVGELDLARDLSRNPLFQVAFALQNAPEEPLRLAGLESRAFPVPHDTVRFDLELHLAPAGEGLAGELLYDRDLFDASTAERLVAQLVQLLEGVAAEPSTPLSELPLVDAAERAWTLAAGCGPATDWPRDRCLHELFAQQVARRPDAVALEWGERRLTYGELDARSARLARLLADEGARPGDRVALCLERGPELIVGLLGVLRAGAAYAPLDPESPVRRLERLIADLATPVLLTAEAQGDALPAFDGPVVRLDTDPRLASDAPEDGDALAPAAVTPQGAAYVIHTSGSTGDPKGVVVPHRAVVRLVAGTDYVALRPGDRVAQASTTTFDAATFEIWGALLNGATLVGVPRDVLIHPGRLAAALRDDRLDVLFLTTALFNQLAGADPALFAPLRALLFGGEAVDPGSVRAVLAAGRPRRLLHVYGPTEATTFSTWHEVREVPADARTVPIGRPLANTRAHVLDAAGGLAPVGVPGELHVGGDGLALGYLNAPELTARRFVPDPLSGEPGARLYRTGDRVRLDAEGRIEFLARVDDQLKIRGHRIEPGEIEAVLLREPGVREAVVVAREDAPGDRRLVAYVVGGRLEALRRACAEQLPAALVPAAMVPLDALPLGATGKVDRRALPAPAARTASREYLAPRTETESRLAAIWAELLRVDRVGVRDDFFELGGHSLLAMQVVSRVRDDLRVELPLQSVFEDSTVEGLGRDVDVLLWAASGSPAEPGGQDLEQIEL